MKRHILSLAVGMAFLCPASLQAKIAYKVIDLGTLGGCSSDAISINDAGRIVGEATLRCSATPPDRWSAVLFDPTGAGKNIDLGTLGGGESSAYSINDAGQIIGWAEYSQEKWFSHACIFDSTGAGNNIDLGTLGGASSEASSINDTGQIVGEAQNSRGHHRATSFDHTGGGNNIDLGTLGGDESSALYINSVGQIVGGADISQGDGHTALFDPTGAGNNIDLGTLGGDWSRAYCINDAGQIVGDAENSEGLWRATLFDPTGAGNNMDLGTLGGNESAASSINDAGQIVGYAYYTHSGMRATLFDSTGAGNNIDLNTLIDPASGWSLTYAYNINASGWIVGRGINPQGEEHAFLLVPKPPCLYAIAGDLNDDCKVDFADLAVMAANWLVDCGVVPTDPACVPK